jgi:signal transduction histidine kinase
MLIDDLLDVSSMRTGKVALNKRLCDIGTLCREVIEDQRLLTEREIVLHAPENPVAIQVDPERITQVITNLVSNALKYSPAKSKVEVYLKREDVWVLLEVKDYGKGINKELQEHIFETFYRTPDAQSSSKRGLGLGLAIAKDIVERHEGRIWCESEPGHGSSFFVKLPANVSSI